MFDLTYLTLTNDDSQIDLFEPCHTFFYIPFQMMCMDRRDKTYGFNVTTQWHDHC